MSRVCSEIKGITCAAYYFDKGLRLQCAAQISKVCRGKTVRLGEIVFFFKIQYHLAQKSTLTYTNLTPSRL